MPNPDRLGDEIQFELLRPLDWMAQEGCEARSDIWVEWPEMGTSGMAHVDEVDSCPPLKSGQGRVVTATLTHLHGHILDLTFVGYSEHLHPTELHRLFSEDRHDWVHTFELRAGEVLRTQHGFAAVASITPMQGIQRVYNIEVETEHRYYVGQSKVLCHNDCGTQTEFHGNDRRNANAQHNYDILDRYGRVRKTGVGTGGAEDGYSARAESQLDDGDSYVIRDRHPAGPGARGRALDREKELAKEHYAALEPMDKHWRPKP